MVTHLTSIFLHFLELHAMKRWNPPHRRISVSNPCSSIVAASFLKTRRVCWCKYSKSVSCLAFIVCCVRSRNILLEYFSPKKLYVHPFRWTAYSFHQFTIRGRASENPIYRPPPYTWRKLIRHVCNFVFNRKASIKIHWVSAMINGVVPSIRCFIFQKPVHRLVSAIRTSVYFLIFNPCRRIALTNDSCIPPRELFYFSILASAGRL